MAKETDLEIMARHNITPEIIANIALKAPTRRTPKEKRILREIINSIQGK